MQASQQPVDYGIRAAPPIMPHINGHHIAGHAQPQSRNDIHMEEGSGPSSHDETPLQKFGRLSMLSGGKSKSKTTKDGLPAKKRGPKRDSKPAVTRKQELNRQAQRTHRERKELYTKGLEMEVNRLKEAYARLAVESTSFKNRAQTAEQQLSESETLKHENDRLKQLLQVNGITYDRLLPVTNGLDIPTQTQTSTAGHVLSLQRHVSPLHGQLNSANQQQQSPAQGFNFNSMPSSFPSSSSDSGQKMMGGTDITPFQEPQRIFSESGMSASPSSVTSSQESNGYHSHSSTNGSSFTQSVLTPISTTNGSSPMYPAVPHLHRQTSSNIDSVISDSGVPPFVPPVGRGLANGAVSQNTGDESVLRRALDDDQLAIDFVLAMEHSCKDHQQHCNRRALPATEHDVNLELSGHAMMLTNPPASHMATDPQTPWFQPPKIPISNLLVLMDTAQNIPMRRGEITPILALKKIREDPRYGLMNRRQFEMLTKRLSEKTRCYGFGSALEEFKVDDELNRIFGTLGLGAGQNYQQHMFNGLP